MPNVSEQEMRIYLLGGLSPERQTELAALIHDDAALQEELLALKEELFDQYLAGSLTADEQLYFKTHFLSTESGQQKLHFARLFQSYCDDHSFAINRVPAPVTPARVTAPLFASFHQNPAYVVSLIVIAKAPLPGFVVPALASATDRVPSGERWIHEIKFDGYRAQVQMPTKSSRSSRGAATGWTCRIPSRLRRRPIATMVTKRSALKQTKSHSPSSSR